MTERDTGPAPGPKSTPGDALAALSARQPIRVVRLPSQSTDELRAKLAEKAAATDELREALDELRQVLDIDAPPPAAAARRTGARLAVLLLALAAAAGAIVIYLLLHRQTQPLVAPGSAASASSTASSTAGSTTGSATGSTTGSAGGTAAGGVTSVAAPVASARPMPWPGGPVVLPPGLVTSGPGVTVPGTDVQAALDDDGTSVDVVERLLLDAPTADPLTLSSATLPGLAAPGVAGLQVQLDDTVVTVSTAAGGARWTARPADGQRYQRVTLRYQLGGGLVTVTPAAPGRSLGVITPLTAAVSGQRSHPVVVRTLDRHVIGVSCPAASGSGVICGSRSPSGWTASLPAGAPAIVLFQLQRP